MKNILLTLLAIAAGLWLGSPRKSIGQSPAVNTNLIVQNLVATAVSSNRIDLTWETLSLDGTPPKGWNIYRDGEWIATVTNRFDAPSALKVY